MQHKVILLNDKKCSQLNLVDNLRSANSDQPLKSSIDVSVHIKNKPYQTLTKHKGEKKLS